MVSIAVIFGPLTDAHVNPAVTTGFRAVGKFPPERVVGAILLLNVLVRLLVL